MGFCTINLRMSRNHVPANGGNLCEAQPTEQLYQPSACPLMPSAPGRTLNSGSDAVKNDCGDMFPCNYDALAWRTDVRAPASAARRAGRSGKLYRAVPDFHQYSGKPAAPVFHKYGDGFPEKALQDTGSRAGAAGYKGIQQTVVFYIDQADSSPGILSVP
jgi:hypothetical protein